MENVIFQQVEPINYQPPFLALQAIDERKEETWICDKRNQGLYYNLQTGLLLNTAALEHRKQYYKVVVQ